MEKKTLKQRIKENPGLKQAVHRFIMHPVKTRPNWWIRLFDFIYLKRGSSLKTPQDAKVLRGDRKSTRLNSSHRLESRMPSSA